MNEDRGKFNDYYGRNSELTYTNLKGGIDCYWNKPNNINANTPTVIHTYGAGIDSTKQDPWYNSQKAATQLDATTVFPVRMNEPIDVFENVYREVLNKTEDTENLILTGHSAGGPTALKALVTMYKEGNVGEPPPTVVMLDGSFKSCKLTEEEIKILADNKVPIVAYYQLDAQTPYYNMLGQNGVNIALIRDYDCNSHDKPCTNFYENQKGLFDFASGRGQLMLGQNGYDVSVWNNGNQVYTNAGNRYDISGINTKDKLYSLWNIDTFAYKITTLQELKNFSLTNLSLSVNHNELETTFNDIIKNIGNTSFVNNTTNITCENGLSTVVKASELATNHFVITTDLLYSIAAEIQQFQGINPTLSKAEEEIINNANNELAGVVSLSNPDNTINQTSEEPAIQETTNTQTEPAPQDKNDSETTKKENDEESKVENTEEEQKDKDELQQENTSSQKEDGQKTEPPAQNTSTGSQNNTTHHKNNNNNNSNNNSGNSSSKNEPLEQFPDYKEVYSDDKKIVYDYNNEYRIIVHKDGNEIIGIEHYYKFGSENEAINAINSLKVEYNNNENMKNIVQKGQYVKVIFKEEMYKNLTVQEIRKQYSQLNEIIKL